MHFDLANPLARQAERPANLLERLRLQVGEAVAEADHLSLALGESGEAADEGLAAKRDLDLVLRRGPVAGDEVSEDRILLLADRLVEARRGPGRSLDLLRLLERQAGLLGDLRERRLAPELGPEQALRLVHLLEPLDDVDGHADRPRL